MSIICNEYEDLSFIKEDEFRIGSIEIPVYGYKKLVTLFDPVGFLDNIDPNIIEKEYKNRKAYLYKEIDRKFIKEVRIKLGQRNYIDKVLVTEQGIYQLIFKINCNECIKMRSSFVNILTAYRKRHGWNLQQFLERTYSQRKYLDIDNIFDARCDSHGYSLLLDSVGYKVLSVIGFYRAPYLDDILVKDERQDYYIDNLNKVKIIEKCVYCLREDRVIEALAKVMAVSDVHIIDEVLGDITVVNITGNDFMSLDADELYIYLTNHLNSKDKAGVVFKRMLHEIFKNPDVVRLLYLSTVEYSELQDDYPILFFESYKYKYRELATKEKKFSSDYEISELSKEYVRSIKRTGNFFQV